MADRKYIPVATIGISYLLSAGFGFAQSIKGESAALSLSVVYALWILLGIAILFKKKPVIILSLLSFPIIFLLQNFYSPLLRNLGNFNAFFYTPFHYISLTIFQKFALTTKVESSWPVYLWIMYAIHLACLSPSLFKRSSKVHEPKPLMEFPEDAFIYDKNGFQILGLIPDEATPASIAKRKSKLSALVRENLSVKDHLDRYHAVPWPNASVLSEAEIEAASSRLEDNLERVKEELFWFHLAEDDREPFMCLLRKHFNRGRELWANRIEKNPESYASALALHNLAVLYHALILDQERTLPASLKGSLEQTRNWQKVFILWKGVHKNDKCWDYFRERKVYLDDPRINDDHIQNIRNQLPGFVLKINIEIAQTELREENLDYARRHLDLVKNSGFDSEDIKSSLELFFSHFAHQFEKIGEGIKKLDNYELKNINEIYKEYELYLKKSIRLKYFAERIDGRSYIEKEISKIISIVTDKIKNDFAAIREKTKAINKEISTRANHLIDEWNKRANERFANVERLTIKNRLEKTAEKLKNLRAYVEETTNIGNAGKILSQEMLKLCCNEEDRNNIISTTEYFVQQNKELEASIAPLESWINRNLDNMRRNATRSADQIPPK